MKGKDDSSAKSKRGKKVHFDPEDSLEAKFSNLNGNFDSAAGKGEGGKVGKGGKGDKGANGGKSQTTKAPAPLELRVEQELPDNTTILMDCEAAEILQGIQDHMVVLSEDPAIKLPESFDRGLKYACRAQLYKSSQAVKEVLQHLRKYGVGDGEICTIANFPVESVDEVFALLPSLKGKKSRLREPLKEALDELVKCRTSI